MTFYFLHPHFLSDPSLGRVTLIRATDEHLIDRAELIRSLDRYIVFEFNLRPAPLGPFGAYRFFAFQKSLKKRLGQKCFFYVIFVIFRFPRARIRLDFKGPGPPPGLIFGVFCGYAFFDRFLRRFLQKKEKMKIAKCAQNTSPASRFEGSAVQEKHTETSKNASKKNIEKS